jgi:hypothetical protein
MANRIEPFSIFCNLPTLATSAVFPTMQRIASISSSFSGSRISFSIPYWLKGIVFDTSLYTPNTLVGVAVVIGQTGQPFVGYSQALVAPANHSAFPNGGAASSQTVFIELPEPGIYIGPNTEIALYGYGSGAGDLIWASAALQLQQPEAV